VDTKEKWTTEYINDLPDSSFLFVEEGGEKDEDEKTTPRSLRHLPYKGADGDVDLPHLRNAISRLGQETTGGEDGWLSDTLRKELLAKARKILDNTDKTKANGLPAEDNADTCVCPECGYEAPHSSGTPCVDKLCPECGTPMQGRNCREDDGEKEVKMSLKEKLVNFAASLLGAKDPQERAANDLITLLKELTEKETSSAFATIKDDSGSVRWLGVSSSHFEDREGEIVSSRALEKLAEDASGYYGPLRFWHVKGLDIGDCDFSMFYKGYLLESGTYRDDPFSQAMAKGLEAAPVQLGMSIGFYPVLESMRFEKGTQGRLNLVYDEVRREERSVLPLDRAANPYTMFNSSIGGNTMAVRPDQLEMLKGLVKNDALVEDVLDQLDANSAAAMAAGAQFKEMGEDLTPENVSAILKELVSGLEEKEENASVIAVLDAAARMVVGESVETKEEKADRILKESLLASLGDYPDGPTKATILAALEEKASKNPFADDEEDEDEEDDDEENKEAPVAEELTEDHPVIKTLRKGYDEQIAKFRADMEAMQAKQDDMTRGTGPLMQASKSDGNIDPNAKSLKESPPSVLDKMADSMFGDNGAD